IEMLAGKGAGALLPCDGSTTPCEGPLLGGNLALLAHLCGTRWAPNFRDAICILEDVGERPYAIDRYVTQLLAQRGGIVLSAAKALVLGDFDRCEENGDPSQDVVVMLSERLRREGLVCSSGLPVGHGARNRAFSFGARARLDDLGLHLLEPATTR
ncbi:MAG: hypothetical protein GY811_19375, partial [Myxococcales bacterium]|nr:hypothetical protein [Myxococcales bacterium]